MIRRENLASNVKAQQLQLQLTDTDTAQIATRDREGRWVDPDGLAPAWD